MKTVRPNVETAIIDASFDVFSSQPNASLSDVADHAGVGRATLHRYFPGRSHLMRALAKTALAELDNAVASATAAATSYEEGFRLSIEAIVPLANRQWFLAHHSFEDEPDIMAAHRNSRDALLSDIAAAQTEGAFAADIAPVWIAELYENMIYTAWSLVRSGEATPRQASDFAWRCLISGIGGQAA